MRKKSYQSYQYFREGDTQINVYLSDSLFACIKKNKGGQWYANAVAYPEFKTKDLSGSIGNHNQLNHDMNLLLLASALAD